MALIAFKQTYNQTWIIERHGYETPLRSEPIRSAGCRWPRKRSSVSQNCGPVQPSMPIDNYAKLHEFLHRYDDARRDRCGHGTTEDGTTMHCAALLPKGALSD